MPSVPKPQSAPEQDKLSEAYDLFFKLFMEKFLRASAIWWDSLVDPKGKSFHQVVRDDPLKAIERLARGKTDRLGRIMVKKFEEALIQWAIEVMGGNFEKYVGRGLERFFIGVMLSPTPNRTFLGGIRKSRLVFPIQLGKESGFPLDRLTELKREYYSVLPKISALKRMKWRNDAAYALALIETLPGTSKTKAANYRLMKPSEVASDYVGRKYGLPLGIEAIKKHLHLIPQDLWDLEFKRNLTLNKKRLPKT